MARYLKTGISVEERAAEDARGREVVGLERCARSIGLERQMAATTAGEAFNRRMNRGSN